MARTHENQGRRGRGNICRCGQLQGIRVLVVEDETIIAMALQASFEDEGAEVIGPAQTLAQGLDLAEGKNISAAVLDLRLGRDPVSPIARKLAARNVPFLFYSGQPPDDPVRAEWPGATSIAKPAQGPRLVDAVLRLVERNDLSPDKALRA